MSQDTFVKFGDIDQSKEIVKKNWGDFRKKINEGEFTTRDIDLALSHIFLEAFNELFNECKDLVGLTKKLDVINSDYEIMRGSKISDGEYSNTITYNRLLPQKSYIVEDNRFSPKGVEWLYLALSDDTLQAKECCIKECRAKESDKFAIVSFEIPDKYRNEKIVDLTVGVEYDYTELEKSLNNILRMRNDKSIQKVLKSFTKKELNMSKEEKLKLIKERAKEETDRISPENNNLYKKFLTLAYSKLLSENIFEPVEIDKSEKYAPFHCLAQYFISIGYSGIIFSSTVCRSGKNLVLFDKEYANPVGEISKFQV